MSVGLRAKQLALGLSFFLVSEPTVAQQNPFGNLIGGIIGGAITEGARQEWSQMPPMLQLCYNVSLRRDNANVQSLIQSGIGPNDPRLSQIRAACDQLINRKFRVGFECNFQLGNRSITTWCDEAYATQARNGGLQRLSVEQAIQASGKGEQLSLGQFEKPDAERRRMQMMQANPAATAVPKPLWDCDKANKASEKAICNSYQLTLIDNQYVQYWNLAKPLDKKREMQKKNTGFYRAGIACNGNEDCIKRNLITAIDTVAEFLKSNGTQVSTYSEQQEAIRKADDERRRVEDEHRRRVAEQQERERQRQREDDERRLAIARAEAEKAKAEAQIRMSEPARSAANNNTQSSSIISSNVELNILTELSYCASSAHAQGEWNNQKGNASTAQTLMSASLSFAKTGQQYGEAKGLSFFQIRAINEKTSARVNSEISSGSFFNSSAIIQRNNSCLELLQSNPSIRNIWANLQNSAPSKSNALGGEIYISLNSVKNNIIYCAISFTAKNKTNYNFNLMLDLFSKETDGTVIEKNIATIARLKPNGESDFQIKTRAKCEEIGSIKFDAPSGGVGVSVDGRIRTDLNDAVMNAINLSSKVKSINLLN